MSEHELEQMQRYEDACYQEYVRGRGVGMKAETLSRETADKILEWANTCWNYEKGLETFTGMVNTLVSEESECLMDKGIHKDCKCHYCRKHGNEITKRKWGEFKDYLSDNERPFVTMSDFPDWLDMEE